MVDPVPPAKSNDDSNVGRDRDAPPGAPRWVKIFAFIALVLAVLFVARHLTSGGFRGHAFP